MRTLETPTLTTSEAAGIVGVTANGIIHMELRHRLTDRAGECLYAERDERGYRMWTQNLVRAALVWRFRVGQINLPTLRERVRRLDLEFRHAEVARRGW